MKKAYNVLRYVEQGLKWCVGKGGKSGGKIVLESEADFEKIFS
jgi:hypothetical protein